MPVRTRAAGYGNPQQLHDRNQDRSRSVHREGGALSRLRSLVVPQQEGAAAAEDRPNMTCAPLFQWLESKSQKLVLVVTWMESHKHILSHSTSYVSGFCELEKGGVRATREEELPPGIADDWEVLNPILENDGFWGAVKSGRLAGVMAVDRSGAASSKNGLEALALALSLTASIEAKYTDQDVSKSWPELLPLLVEVRAAMPEATEAMPEAIGQMNEEGSAPVSPPGSHLAHVHPKFGAFSVPDGFACCPKCAHVFAHPTSG